MAALLLSLPSQGQESVFGSGAINIRDAAFNPVTGVLEAKTAAPYGTDAAKITVGTTLNTKPVVGVLERVDVILEGLSHPYLADVDILLAGPGGNVLLVSDAAIGYSASGTYTITGNAANNFPDGLPIGVDPGTILPTSSYKPTDFAPAETFASPAAAGPYATSLSVFNGLSPVGDWQLFVMDDRPNDAGQIGRFGLTFYLTPVGSVTNTTINVDEDGSWTLPVTANDTDTATANITVTATSSDQTIITNSIAGLQVTAPASGNVFNLRIAPLANRNSTHGPVTVSVVVADNNGGKHTNILNVVIAPKNDAPSLGDIKFSGTSTNTLRANQGEASGAYTIDVSDIDSNINNLVLRAESTDTNIVLSTDVVFSGTGGTRTFTVNPKGNATGTATIRFFVRDDEGASSLDSAVKEISFVVTPRADRSVFANFTPLGLPDNSSSSTISSLTVANLNTTIGDVTVTLADVTHASPEDLDVLLEGPTGVKVVLMGQAGGANALSRGRFTFSSGTPAPADAIPDNAAILNQAYRPADYAIGDIPGAGAAGTYSADLTAFRGSNPNGTWKLYAIDRVTGAVGAINGGYVLNIFSRPTITGLGDRTVNEDSGNLEIAFTVGDVDGNIASVTATVADGSKATRSVTYTSPATTGTLRLTPVADANGVTAVTVLVTDAAGYTLSTNFNFTITSINDQPTISPINKQITYVGQPPAAIDFTVTDVETPAGSLAILKRSSNAKLLPEANIVVEGSTGARTVRLFPAGNESGTVDITLTVRDADGAERPTIFRLDVLFSPVWPNQTTINIQDTAIANIATNAAGNPFKISVSNYVGQIQKTTVNVVGLKHPFPDDLDILLVGPNGKRVFLMSDAGGLTAIDNTQLVFSDEATPSLPDSGLITSGTWKPTNFDAGDGDLMIPAAGGTLESTLAAAFAGISPNGDWFLYVMDDNGNNKGDANIALGWMLSFQTSPSLSLGSFNATTQVFSVEATPERTVAEDGAVTVDLNIGDLQPSVPTLISVTSNKPGIIANFDSTTAEFPTLLQTDKLSNTQKDIRRMTIRPVANAFDEAGATLTVTVTVGGQTSIRTVLVKVTPVNDAPSFGALANQTTPQGTILGPVAFTISDLEAADASTIEITASSDNVALPSSNIIIRKTGAGNRTLTIIPSATTSTITATITLTATDPADSKLQATKAITYTAAQSISFLNPETIDILDGTAARPYPSKIMVGSGIKGSIRSVQVTLYGLSHSFPDDIHALLVSPTGTKVMLMGNAGGGAPTNSIPEGAAITLGFSDSASDKLADDASGLGEGKLQTGKFRPGVYSSPSLPAPAPAGPYADTLATFSGTNPAGEWQLFVFDDTRTDAGKIAGGWGLVFTTSPTIAAVGPFKGVEDTRLDISVDLLDEDTAGANLTLTAVPATEDLATAANVTIDPATTNLTTRTVRIAPKANVSGTITNEIVLTVGDGTAPNFIRNVKFSFAPVNDAPVITTITNRIVVPEDTATNLFFTVKDVDSIVDRTNITFTSSNETLAPVGRWFLGGPTGGAANTDHVVLLNVFPATNANSTATGGEFRATFRVTDNDRSHDGLAQITENVVFVTVTPVNDLPVLVTGIPNTNVVAGDSLRDIRFEVRDGADNETPAKQITVRATSNNQAILPDANLVVSENDGRHSLTLSTIGTNAAVVTVSLEIRDTDGGVITPAPTFTVTVSSPIPKPTGRTFANTGAITIRDRNTATPSPSTVAVSGLVGRVHTVQVVLNGLAHTAPDDLDILLRGPNGKGVYLTSDAGGRIAVTNLQVAFDDSVGALPLRDDGPLAPGTWRTSNYSGDLDDVAGFAGTVVSDLQSAFQGSNPNGNWELYVIDDQANDVGAITQGWSIVIVTTPTIELVAGQPTLLDFLEDAATGGNTTQVLAQDLDNGTPAAGLRIDRTLVSGPSGVIDPAKVTLSTTPGPAPITVTFVPDANKYDESTNLVIRVSIVRTNDNASASLVITNIVRARNDVPTMTRTTDVGVNESETVTVSVTVDDVIEPVGNNPLTLVATSSNPAAINVTNILINGVGGTNNNLTVGQPIAITIRPNVNAAAAGDVFSDITLVATDNSSTTPGKQSSVPTLGFGIFRVTVKQFNDAPTIAAVDAQTIRSGETGTFGITVADVDSAAGIKVTATSSDEKLVKPSKIVIAPETGGVGARTVTVTPEIASTGTAVITLKVSDGDKFTTRDVTVRVTVSRERRYEGGAIVINDLINNGGAASPYPSLLSIDDLVGLVSRVRVEIKGFKHGYPDDVDLVLSSPKSTNVVVMSDAGGSTPVDNITLLFSNGAADTVPDSSSGFGAGTFKPFNHDLADVFPSGGPVGGMTADLTTLNGASAKGVWKLSASDDTRIDSGSIGSWALLIETQPYIDGLPTAPLALTEDKPLDVNFTIIEENFADKNYRLASVASTNASVVAASAAGVSVSQISEGNYKAVVNPVLNASGATRLTLTLTNLTGDVVTGSFNVIVAAENDQPTIDTVAPQSTVAGRAISFEFNYSDVETAKKDMPIVITSDNPALLPTNNIVIVGSTLLIAPVGNMTGDANVTITVSDTASPVLSATTSFKVTVAPALHNVLASTSGITIRDANTADPYPSQITASGLKGNVAKVTVTLAQVSHPYPADIDVLLVHTTPAGATKRVVILSDAAGGRRLDNVRFTFDDAGVAVPENPATAVASGTYRPSNYDGTTDTFAAPAPAGPYDYTLASFAGMDPNGTWQLFVVDDGTNDAGNVRDGWILNITTTQPTVSDIADVITAEDTPVNVAFKVADDGAIGSLVVTRSVDRASLLTLGLPIGPDANGNVVIPVTPVLNANGEAVVTVEVSDGTPGASGVNTSSKSFKVTVTPVNDAPQFVGLAASLSLPSNKPVSSKFKVTDAESAAADLVVDAMIADASFGSVQVKVIGDERSLEVQPKGLLGTTSVNVTVSDGTVTVTNVVALTIGAPYVLTVSAIADQTTKEDTSKVVPFSVTGSESGKVDATATAADTSLIASVQVVGSGTAWNVNIVPAADQSGTTTITVLAKDEFGVGSQTFNVTVEAVNDAPVLAVIADQVTVRDQTAQIALDVSDKDTALGTLKYSSSSSNPALIKSVLFSLTADGRVIASVFPVSGEIGDASLTVFVDDGTTKVARPFLLSVVAPPNAAPVLAPIPDQETTANITLVVPLVITDPDTAPSKMSFSSANSNSGVVRSILFSLSGSTVSATIRPQPNATGVAAITINVQDGDNRVSRTFILTVKPTPNEPSVIGPISDQTTVQNKSVEVALNVTDTDTVFADLVISANASNPFLADLTVTKVGELATLKLAPKLDAVGVSTITVTVNDGKNSVTRVFSFGVSAAPLPKVEAPAVKTNSDGTKTISLTWANGGELEVADSPAGPWTKTGNRTGSFTGSASGGFQFYRISRTQ